MGMSKVFTSPDGVDFPTAANNWTVQDSATGSNQQTVANAGVVFVMLGYGQGSYGAGRYGIGKN
jgi:hypothetical protein